MKKLIAVIRSRLNEIGQRPAHPGGFCWYSCRDSNTGLTMVCHLLVHEGGKHHDKVYGSFYSAAPAPAPAAPQQQRGHRKPER